MHSTNWQYYLRFLKPHQRQKKYLLTKSVSGTRLMKASANIPNWKLSSCLASQVVRSWVVRSQASRAGLSRVLQSKKSIVQDGEWVWFVSWLHCFSQHSCCLWIDAKYHDAPSICTHKHLSYLLVLLVVYFLLFFFDYALNSINFTNWELN